MSQSHKSSRRLPSIAVPMKTGNPISMYTGVTWSPKLKKWVVQITRKGVTKSLGTFPKEEEMKAAQAYIDAAERYERLKNLDLVG